MESNLYSLIKEKVREQLDLSRNLSDASIQEIIDQSILHFSRKQHIPLSEKTELSKRLFNSLRRLDVLSPLVEDANITEIMINGKSNIFIERQGWIQPAGIQFESDEKLEDVIQNIVSKVNRVVNESSPICDARLDDGSRVNIVLPPISLGGPIVTIRKFLKQVISIEQLIEWGTITREAAEFLKKAVDAKLNIFISGGTGSGKTTLLNILTNFIPEDERIVTIEDSAELQIKKIRNLVRLETRTANTEGRGAIGIRDLIRNALRMRPDRIIVGEVRGVEAIDMLQAMNTGHDGSISTGHANSAHDMLYRLETMILTVENLPISAIKRQISSSIDLIIHLGRMRDKSRKVVEISELGPLENGEYHLNPIFKYEMDFSGLSGQLIRTDNQLICSEKFLTAGYDV